MEKWISKALECGFTHACPMDVSKLVPMEMVRSACASDKCGAYGKNWSCPPYCGTLEECGDKLRAYSRGILLQTVGMLEKTIDTKGYARVEGEHLAAFYRFAEQVRREYPNALCLASGGCRICGSCAWPEPCRFPEKAFSSMEGYGLFVTRVCRDNGMEYSHGPRTVSYCACVLFP